METNEKKEVFCPITFLKKDSQMGEPTVRTLAQGVNDMFLLPFQLDMINIKQNMHFQEDIIKDASDVYLEMNIRNSLYSIASEFLTDLLNEVNHPNKRVFAMMAINYLEQQMVYLFRPTVKDVAQYANTFDIWICHLANILTYNGNFREIGIRLCRKYIDSELVMSEMNFSFWFNSISAVMRDVMAAKIPFLYQVLVYIINTKDNMNAMWDNDEEREKYVEYLSENVFQVEDQIEE